MEEYSIIQGQTLLEMTFALVLIVVTAFVYVSCRIYARRRNPGHVARITALREAITQNHRESFSAPVGYSRLYRKNSFVRDWLASIIVWAAVILTMLAVLSILLGES